MISPVRNEAWVLDAFLSDCSTWADLIVMAVVSFFLFIMSFHFKSKIVNYIASSCVAVYVVQEGGLISYDWFVIPSDDPWVNIGYLFVLTFGFFIAAIALDKLRLFILGPIYNVIYRKVKKFDDKYPLS